MATFTCQYTLDERIDQELGQLCWDLFRSIQPWLGDRINIPLKVHQGVKRELLPDPAQVWTLYYASLIVGASDAALTLAVHNLGREARFLARQIFEYLFKAQYFSIHPKEAKRELEAEPFRELWLLEDLRYDQRTARYRSLKAECLQLAKRRPQLFGHARRTRKKEPPSLPFSMGRPSRQRNAAYVFHYRLKSQALHGGVLGVRDIVTGNGIQFDSREPDPNLTLLEVCRYLGGFLPVEVAKPIEKAQAWLAELRGAGLSPGHGGEAAKRRGAKIADANRKRARVCAS